MSVLAASLATDIGVPGAKGISIVGVFKFLDAVIIISRRRGIPVRIILCEITSSYYEMSVIAIQCLRNMKLTHIDKE